MNVHLPSMWTSGWIEVICGSMFSGKTEELIQRLKRAQIAKQKVQVFKPKIDNRYSDHHVTSHSSLKLEACNVEHPEEILGQLEDNTRIIGVDEAQFFPHAIVEVTQRLANRGLRVIIAGLDMDYRGVPFGSMPTLMAVAEYVTKMSAICVSCGNPASRTQRKIMASLESESLVLVGADELYEARCRRCFEYPK